MKKNGSEIGGSLRKGGWVVPNHFISFPSDKHVFITIGIFLSDKNLHLLKSIDLTRK